MLPARNGMIIGRGGSPVPPLRLSQSIGQNARRDESMDKTLVFAISPRYTTFDWIKIHAGLEPFFARFQVRILVEELLRKKMPLTSLLKAFFVIE
jgi:hypothetical protein